MGYFPSELNLHFFVGYFRLPRLMTPEGTVP